jgi:hypothetical protein
MTIKGFDELSKKLEKMAKAAEELDGELEVPIKELLTDAFMRMHTKYASVQELFDASGFVVNTPDDFKAIPDDAWDQFIRGCSNFSDWNEMLQKATAEYVKRKMGL